VSTPNNQAPDFETVELRVLHGPQAGARLVLQPGRDYILGTGDSCAVVLAGVQVEEEHASLSADASGIRVKRLQGSVATPQGDIGADGSTVPLGTVLTMGRVKLTVEASDADWPSDESIEPEEAAPPTPVADEATAAAEAMPEGALPEPAAAQETSPERASRAARVLRLIRQRPVDAAAAGAALLCAIVTAGILAAMSFPQDANPAPTGEAAAAPQEEAAPPEQGAAASKDASDGAAEALAQLVKTVPHAVLKTTRTETGTWVISGLVADDGDRQILRDGAAQLGIPIEMRVFDEAQRFAAVGKFVEARRSPNGLALRVERGADHTLRIAGAAQSPKEAAAFEELARRELADFEPLQFALLQPVDVRAQFMQRLRSAGLQDRFTVVRAEPQLELKAVLTRQEIRTWETMFSEFAGVYGSVVRVTATVEAEGDNLIASIAVVVGGPYPFIVTKSGERIAPGGTLGGRTVVAVRDSEIVLAGGMRLRYGP
jgi:type III secretion system YscD/HrpQ family protein